MYTVRTRCIVASTIRATDMTQQSEFIEKLRAERKISRRQRPYAQRKSKLAQYSRSIIDLHDNGATLGDIQHYLRSMAKPPVQVERSTIMRFLHTMERT